MVLLWTTLRPRVTPAPCLKQTIKRSRVQLRQSPPSYKCSTLTDSKRALKARHREQGKPFSISVCVCVQPQEAEFCIFRGRNNSLISLVFMPVSHFLLSHSCSPPTHCTASLTPLSLKSACKNKHVTL